MADHVGERNRRIFVCRTAVAGEAHGGDTGCVDDAAHAVFARGLQDGPRAFDVRAVHFFRIAHPEPVVGGDVENDLAVRHGFFEGRGIAQIAGRGFGLEVCEIFQVAGGADEQAEVGALLR